MELLRRGQVRVDELEEERQADEDRGGGEPPAAWEGSRQRHHHDQCEADEQELSAELEPVREERLEIAAVGLVVAPVPPDLRQAERHLRDPDEREPDHPEQHPRADPAGRRLLRVVDPVLGVHHEDAEQDELRDHELDAEEELVAVGSLERFLRDAGQRAVAEDEIVGDDALPERPGCDPPQAGEHEQDDRPRRRAPVRQTASGSSSDAGGSGSGSAGSGTGAGSGSGGGWSAGLACG